jgi:hypothetical protein
MLENRSDLGILSLVRFCSASLRYVARKPERTAAQGCGIRIPQACPVDRYALRLPYFGTKASQAKIAAIRTLRRAAFADLEQLKVMVNHHLDELFDSCRGPPSKFFLGF